jgi:peptidoglycan/xylan/chitin deacetylase (PgdA/CDA1 family)
MTSEDGAGMINICFHGIGVPRRDLEPGEDAYWVDTERFTRVLDEIAGWPSVRISFDDGNISDVQFGLPALVQRGLIAQFFVLAGRLGTPGSLDEDDVCELRHHGMTVGTHGMNHSPWRGMSPQVRHVELVEARRRIAEVVGSPVTEAACPLGWYDRRLLADLRRLGYTQVYTSDRRHSRPESWLQPRFSVRSEDTPASLRADVLARPGVARWLRQTAVGSVKRFQ